MPIKLPSALPAYDVLTREGVMVMDEDAAARQDIRPLRIGLLNLMPKKIQTENQFARLIGATPLQIEFCLIRMSEHQTRNTAAEHMEEFYRPFQDVKHEKFDGLIITGAPIEHLDFERCDLLGRTGGGHGLDPDQRAFHFRRLLGRDGDDASFPWRAEAHPARQALRRLSPHQPRPGLALPAGIFGRLHRAGRPAGPKCGHPMSKRRVCRFCWAPTKRDRA